MHLGMYVLDIIQQSNKDITAQIISASIAGDLVLASAYSHELPRYGLEVGLTNYAAGAFLILLLFASMSVVHLLIFPVSPPTFLTIV